MRANATCNLTTVTLTQDVAYILIRFLCNTGNRVCIFRFWLPTPAKSFRLWQNPFFDSDSRQKPSTPTLQHWSKLAQLKSPSGVLTLVYSVFLTNALYSEKRGTFWPPLPKKSYGTQNSACGLVVTKNFWKNWVWIIVKAIFSQNLL